jgi:hypothetical protein
LRSALYKRTDILPAPILAVVPIGRQEEKRGETHDFFHVIVTGVITTRLLLPLFPALYAE